MSGQQFDTLDQLSLEIEQGAAPGQLVNLVRNPNGELGGWGWITPVPGSAMSGAAGVLTYAIAVSVPNWFYTEPLPVAAGQYAAASWVSPSLNGHYRTRFEWLDAAGAVIASTVQSADTLGSPDTRRHGPHLAPAGTAYVRLRFDRYSGSSGTGNPGSGDTTLTQVTVATAATAGALGTAPRVNLIRNPSFETNATSWSGKDAAVSRSTAAAYAGAASLKMDPNVFLAHAAHPTGEGAAGIPVTPGLPYTLQGRSRAAVTAADWMQAQLVWWTAAGGFIAYSLGAQLANTTGGWTLHTVTGVAPSNAAYVSVRFQFDAGFSSAGHEHYLDAVMLEQSASVGAYFDGATPDAGTIDYAWTGTAHGSSSTQTEAAGLSYLPKQWLSILGTAHNIETDRAPLDVGTLTGALKDVALDPAQSDTLRPGRECRLTIAGSGEPILTGVLRHADVSYNLRDSRPNKRAVISFTVTDAATELANVPQPEGVATIGELSHVLEGAGVPWNVNGSSGQVTSAAVVALNDSATVLDQLALTRDSALGHVWIDRAGIVQAWDEAALGATLAATLDESDYTDLAVDFDTDRAINVVTVKFLRTNPGSGETEEVTYGPFSDADSVREWGAHAKTFSIQWAEEDPAAIETYALAILAANATPAIRVNALSLPIRTLADLAGAALLDLGQLVRVINTDAGIDDQLRIVGVSHRISARRWTLDLTFARDGQVAPPQYTPPPSGGAGGLTLSELLRPVGEVTMFYGTPAQIPAGWLECNGASYSTTDYPKLAAHLATANPALPAGVLPDYNDRFIVGASTAKPLASIGGAASVPLPAHTHAAPAQTKQTNTTTGGTATRVSDLAATTGAVTGTNPPVDTVPPYRAIRLIIRAR